MKQIAKGTWFEDKLCTCKHYEAKQICATEHEHTAFGCPPPQCKNCGGWPDWPIRKCDRCTGIYYHWFVHNRTISGYNSFRLCWDCLEAHCNADHEYSGRTKLRPPQEIIPPKRTLAEILAGLGL